VRYALPYTAQRRINAKVVADLAADMLRAIAEHSKADRAEFFKAADEAQDARRSADIVKKRNVLPPRKNGRPSLKS
jgi:hypothetical protein